VACSRTFFQTEQAQVQQALYQLNGHSLLDLHVSDLLNSQLPSRFDLTSYYDILVFRRLASANHETPNSEVPGLRKIKSKLSGPPPLGGLTPAPLGLQFSTMSCSRFTLTTASFVKLMLRD
jgi:hypothetical protein